LTGPSGSWGQQRAARGAWGRAGWEWREQAGCGPGRDVLLFCVFQLQTSLPVPGPCLSSSSRPTTQHHSQHPAAH
jgi:hypothetical protein